MLINLIIYYYTSYTITWKTVWFYMLLCNCISFQLDGPFCWVQVLGPFHQNGQL
jgi:hypothetical protein